MSQWVAMSQMMNQKMKKDTNEEEGEVEDGEEESAEVEEIKTTGQKGGKFTGHYDDLEGERVYYRTLCTQQRRYVC